MEKPDNPIRWDRLPKKDFNLVMRAKTVFERLKTYSGRNIHEVNGAAGVILNSAYNFLFCFTDKGRKLGRDKYDEDGGDTFAECVRKQVVSGIERGLDALKER